MTRDDCRHSNEWDWLPKCNGCKSPLYLGDFDDCLLCGIQFRDLKLNEKEVWYPSLADFLGVGKEKQLDQR